MKNKDFAFFSFIIVWMFFVLAHPFKGIECGFIVGMFIMFILRHTVLKNWWERDVRLKRKR